jgi:hypothetical protein
MGNIIQTFVGPDGKDLGPGCGVSWVQVGRHQFFSLRVVLMRMQFPGDSAKFLNGLTVVTTSRSI